MDFLKTNRRLCAALFACITLLLAGCGKTDKDILQKYIGARSKGDYKTAYACLSPADRQAVSLAEYSETGSVILTELNRYSEYDMVSRQLSPSQNTVTYTVAFHRPSLPEVYKRLPELMHPDIKPQTVKSVLRANKTDVNAAKVTTEERFTLIKDNDNWYVEANLGSIKYINQLKKTALDLEERGLFDEALATLDKLYEAGGIDDAMSKAYVRIADKQNYINSFLKIAKIFTDTAARIVVTNEGTYGIKKLALDIQYEKDGVRYNAHKTSVLTDKPFIGHGDKYTFHIDFNGGTIMNVSKLDARIVNIEF